MPPPYSLDLRWRIIWLSLTTSHTPATISRLFTVSERTVWRYLSLFNLKGDVQVAERRDGPICLMGDFEQLILLRLILENPGVYLHELQVELFHKFGVPISIPTICRTLKSMGCTRQAMHRVALQRSDAARAEFMSVVSVYDPNMLVWLDESGCDRRDAIRKYGYSVRGIPICDQRLLIRGKRYTAIPVMSLGGIHDVFITEGNMNGERFANFVKDVLSPHLMPFNGLNPRSVVIMDNASIHHVHEVIDLIETQVRAKVLFLPPYSPDLNPVEGIFSQVKSTMKENDRLFQVFSAPRVLLSMAFEAVTTENCLGHIRNSGYI